MTQEEFELFINKIQKKLMEKFKEWQTENKEAICSANSDGDYPEKVIKIMGNKLTKTQIYTRMKQRIYDYLKKDFKTIVA